MSSEKSKEALQRLNDIIRRGRELVEIMTNAIPEEKKYTNQEVCLAVIMMNTVNEGAFFEAWKVADDIHNVYMELTMRQAKEQENGNPPRPTE